MPSIRINAGIANGPAITRARRLPAMITASQVAGNAVAMGSPHRNHALRVKLSPEGGTTMPSTSSPPSMRIGGGTTVPNIRRFLQLWYTALRGRRSLRSAPSDSFPAGPPHSLRSWVPPAANPNSRPLFLPLRGRPCSG